MNDDTDTNRLPQDDIRPDKNPLFEKLPEQYYGYALQWCVYPRWTLEEAANLLTGCVPHREMFLRGEAHRKLDEEVLANENRIRAALGKALRVVESKKYFSKTYIDSSSILAWAKAESIPVPPPLARAFRETARHRERHGYRTPCMSAVEWVVERFWEPADLRDPPTPGEIVQALLQEFPDLDAEDCEAVEHVARHPAARVNLEDLEKDS